MRYGRKLIATDSTKALRIATDMINGALFLGTLSKFGQQADFIGLAGRCP